jgi:hypothetical protein
MARQRRDSLMPQASVGARTPPPNNEMKEATWQ